MSAKSTPYRFRPRFLGVAFLSLSVGVVLIAAGATVTPDRMSTIFSFIMGTLGLFLGFAYLKSPVWKLAVDIEDTELVIWNGHEERLRLPWTEVQRVVVDADHLSCYVDGGSPDRSLLVPGPGAAASYDIRHKKKLVAQILERIPSDKVIEAEDLSMAPESAPESAPEESPECTNDPTDH